MCFLSDEGKIKSLRQSWEEAKNRSVTHTFSKKVVGVGAGEREGERENE